MLENPLAEPFTTMRATPVVGLLQSARHNVRRGAKDLALFEVGHVYGRAAAAGALEDRIREVRRAAVLLAGRSGTATGRSTEGPSTSSTGRAPSRRSSAGSAFRSSGLRARVAPVPRPRPRRPWSSGADGARLGWVGVLAAPLAAAWDLDDPVVADLDLEALEARVPAPPTSVEAPPRLPGSEVDLTVTHALAAPWTRARVARRAGAPPELVAVEAKGRYRGAGVPDGFVKTTLTLRFGSATRSLSREEINAWRDAAAARLLALPGSKVDGIAAGGA